MIKIGGTEITDIAVGSTPIKKAYLGGDLLWEKSSPVLPYDAEVEYLRNTGLTQYINTGVLGGEGLRIVTTFTSRQSVRDKWAIASIDTNARIYVIYQYPAGKYGGGYGNYFSGSASMAVGQKVNLDIEYTSSQQIIKIDGTSYSFNKNSFTGTVTKPLYLFGRSGGLSSFLCDIGRTQIYMNGVLVRDYIPVRKNGVGYMYDTLDGELHGNDGTGSFTLGPDVT